MKNTCNKLKKYDCYELVNNCFKKNIQNVLIFLEHYFELFSEFGRIFS